jgi:8-oxo-dGTP pyrophosphatase MutT (NUDIX family)
LPGEKAHKLMMPEGRNLYPSNGDTPRLSAVLILFYEEEGELYFPLIKRPTYNGAHSGQMAFPGGKHEPGESIDQTALRETHEEIGVPSEQVELIGQLSDLYIPVTNMLVKPFVAISKKKPIFKLDPIEVAALHPVNIKEFLNPQIKITEQWDIRGIGVKVPFYLLDEQKVWGATAMILSELEEIVSL